ncbi:MAG TPA: DNA polymerase III subunit chi [Steroidobacteraceae bacterium]|nr:DNA polymerase III subunit chi [Steroidobacteraceae bacterium]
MNEAANSARNGGIRFYTLKEGGARLRQACLLVEQAFLAGERVLVWFDGADEMARFDDLLWTFGDRSFVPHEPLQADPAACEAPVQLHAGALPEGAAAAFGTLVMLREQPAPEALRFARVVEVVDAEPACRNAGRARFRWYREQGATPEHIEVAS